MGMGSYLGVDVEACPSLGHTAPASGYPHLPWSVAGTDSKEEAVITNHRSSFLKVGDVFMSFYLNAKPGSLGLLVRLVTKSLKDPMAEGLLPETAKQRGAREIVLVLRPVSAADEGYRSKRNPPELQGKCGQGPLNPWGPALQDDPRTPPGGNDQHQKLFQGCPGAAISAQRSCNETRGVVQNPEGES